MSGICICRMCSSCSYRSTTCNIHRWRDNTFYHGAHLITVPSVSVHSPFSNTGSLGGTLTTSPNLTHRQSACIPTPIRPATTLQAPGCTPGISSHASLGIISWGPKLHTVAYSLLSSAMSLSWCRLSWWSLVRYRAACPQSSRCYE